MFTIDVIYYYYAARSASTPRACAARTAYSPAASRHRAVAVYCLRTMPPLLLHLRGAVPSRRAAGARCLCARCRHSVAPRALRCRAPPPRNRCLPRLTLPARCAAVILTMPPALPHTCPLFSPPPPSSSPCHADILLSLHWPFSSAIRWPAMQPLLLPTHYLHTQPAHLTLLRALPAPATTPA